MVNAGLCFRYTNTCKNFIHCTASSLAWNRSYPMYSHATSHISSANPPTRHSAVRRFSQSHPHRCKMHQSLWFHGKLQLYQLEILVDCKSYKAKLDQPSGPQGCWLWPHSHNILVIPGTCKNALEYTNKQLLNYKEIMCTKCAQSTIHSIVGYRASKQITI